MSRVTLWLIGALLSGWMPGLAAAQPEQSAPLALVPSADDLFDGSDLHDIWIHINARDWEQLRESFQQNTYYPCDLEWQGMRVRNAGIRSRGSGSRSATKPGLQLDFGRYVTGQEFVGLKSLVLDNLWQDPSMIRERLTMLLFQRMGLPAPREAHARVYVGSHRDFIGVYAIVEQIDERFLTRQFDEDTGYLYEYRWMDEYHFEDLGPDLEPYAARFEPRNHATESTFSLFAPIQEMVRAINEAPASDLDTLLAPYLDLGQFLTHVAIENFLSERDGLLGTWGLNNFYLYRFAGRSLSQVIVWDKDNTFTSVETPPWQNADQNVLMRKVWAVPRLRAMYLRKLIDSAALADGWLEGEINLEYQQIRSAARADPVKPFSNDEFEQGVEDLRRFARSRGEEVRRMVAQVDPDLSSARSRP